MTTDRTGSYELLRNSSRRHWHLIVRHRHPEWHGHCKRGHTCERTHWHGPYRHRHTEDGR